MHALGERHHAQRGVGDVQLREHQQPVQIARLLADQRDAAIDDLFAEDFAFLADEIVDRPDDVAAQRRPGIDGQHGRKILVVDLRRRLARARAFQLGDRQHFVAREVLRRKQQPHVERAELKFLVVAAEAFVLDRLLHFAVADFRAVAAGRHVGRAQLELRHGQKNANDRFLLERLFQIEAVHFLARFERDERAVFQPGVAQIHLELIIADGLVADFDRPQPVIVVMVPLFAGGQRFGPIAIGGLKMLRP